MQRISFFLLFLNFSLISMNQEVNSAPELYLEHLPAELLNQYVVPYWLSDRNTCDAIKALGTIEKLKHINKDLAYTFFEKICSERINEIITAESKDTAVAQCKLLGSLSHDFKIKLLVAFGKKYELSFCQAAHNINFSDSSDILFIYANQFSFDESAYDQLLRQKIPIYELVNACNKKKYPEPDLLKFLIESKVFINGRNERGWSALGLAIESHNNKAVKHLIAVPSINLELSVHQSNFISSLTPLLFSIFKKRKKITQYLINAGAHKNATDNQGNDAIILATRMHSIPIVKLLLENSFSRNHFNLEGETARCIAKKQNLSIIKQLLEQNDKN